jgi:hypothetical protein
MLLPLTFATARFQSGLTTSMTRIIAQEAVVATDFRSLVSPVLQAHPVPSSSLSITFATPTNHDYSNHNVAQRS